MSISDSVQDDGSLKISLANDLREIAATADRIEKFCAGRGVPSTAVFAVNLSIDELVSNIIQYGYEDKEEHRIELAIRLDGNVIAVEIADDGIAFEPASAADPDIDASLEDRTIGGLGIFLTRQMMDSFEYRRVGGRNVVTLTKNI